MVRYLILTVLFSLALCEVKVDDDGVLDLTQGTFQEGLDSADYVLVEFFAPWCGHCKALAPEYAKAAASLAQKEVSAKLAKVDATVETALGKEYGVRGYPTLKWFKKGSSTPSEYNGGRTAEEIVNWILKKTGPPAQSIDDETNFNTAITTNDATVVGFFAKKEGDSYKAFIAAAQDIDDIVFVETSIESLKTKYSLDEGKIAIFRQGEDEATIFDGSVELPSFIKTNRLPFVVEFDDETAPKIFGGELKTHVLFFSGKADYPTYSADFIKVAQAFRGKAIFVYLDTSKDSNGRVLEFFNIKPEEAPQLRVIKMEQDMEKFKPDAEIKYDVDGMTAFISGVLDGTIKKHLMTEDLAEDWDKEPVKVLTGNSLAEKIKGKDALIEFYAPWCGHCKALAPIYDELGEHYKDNADIMIAKVDSTKNEVDMVDVKGFPTIVLIKKDGEVVNYSGGRTFDDLKSFVDSRGANQGSEGEDEDVEELDIEEEGATKDEL